MNAADLGTPNPSRVRRMSVNPIPKLVESVLQLLVRQRTVGVVSREAQFFLDHRGDQSGEIPRMFYN